MLPDLHPDPDHGVVETLELLETPVRMLTVAVNQPGGDKERDRWASNLTPKLVTEEATEMFRQRK